METDFKSIKTEELVSKLADLKTQLENTPTTWNSKKSHVGRCEGCRYGDNAEKDQQVIKLGDENFCKEHYTKYEVDSATSKLRKEIKEYSDEVDFRQKLESITKTSQIKDIIKTVKAVMKRERDRGYGDMKFSEEEKENAKRLLRLLVKLRPKSSKFIDRGIAINEDLFLSGTIVNRNDRWSSPRNKVTLTALDQNENYKSIARVSLTIEQAERLRNSLVDCIEHVKIYRMIADIGRVMHIKVAEEDEFEDDDEE